MVIEKGEFLRAIVKQLGLHHALDDKVRFRKSEELRTFL